MQEAAISEHKDRIIKDVDGELYLPMFAVYGPNGGGKFNVLEAINILVVKNLRPICATADTEGPVILQKRIIVESFAFYKSTERVQWNLNYSSVQILQSTDIFCM